MEADMLGMVRSGIQSGGEAYNQASSLGPGVALLFLSLHTCSPPQMSWFDMLPRPLCWSPAACLVHKMPPPATSYLALLKWGPHTSCPSDVTHGAWSQPMGLDSHFLFLQSDVFLRVLCGHLGKIPGDPLPLPSRHPWMCHMQPAPRELVEFVLQVREGGACVVSLSSNSSTSVCDVHRFRSLRTLKTKTGLSWREKINKRFAVSHLKAFAPPRPSSSNDTH